MNEYTFTLSGATLTALPSGALWWKAEQMLVVSDLHLGKSERMARRGGPLLPPYEVAETLYRLDDDLRRTAATVVICLGDSFDDLAAATLADEATDGIVRMMSGRRWVWIAGNHDPAPVALGGDHLAQVSIGPLTFRHIAQPGATGEVTGHFHPKMRLAGQSRRCFLTDGRKVILPAYGTYTGGLAVQDSALASLMGNDAIAVLTGRTLCAVPMRPHISARRAAPS